MVGFLDQCGVHWCLVSEQSRLSTSLFFSHLAVKAEAYSWSLLSHPVQTLEVLSAQGGLTVAAGGAIDISRLTTHLSPALQ